MNCLKSVVSIIILAAALSCGVLSAEEVFHVVGAGETIFSISRVYRVRPEELMRSNGITDPSRLQTGRRLVIPGSGSPGVPAAAPADSTGAGANTQTLIDHRVVRGDTLFALARTYEISVPTLIEINKFPTNHVIKVGDIIKVPVLMQRPGETAAAAQGDPEIVIPGPDTSLRWPVNPRGIAYMTGQMGVIVQGEQFEPVKSLTQGKVISAGPWRKFGKVAIIEVSGGYFYVYGGCESLSVKVGDSIGPGTELGKLGINAVSEKPQLFFMVFQSNTPIDPARAPRAGGNVKT